MITAMMQRYFPDWNGEVSQGASGWNNTTYFVANGADRYVLRIYAHHDIEKIKFEHAVLEELRHASFSFKVPALVKTITGESVVPFEENGGRLACLFELIEGLRPNDGDSRSAYSFGESASELSTSLAMLDPGVPPVYRPYYELQHSYPECSRGVIVEFCENPPEAFVDLQESLVALGQAYVDISGKIAGIEKLPQQLVHGDLNFSNLLVDKNDPQNVIALLDFEFCTRDVRVMEPAVIISGLLEHEGKREAIQQFCMGYGSKMKFMPDEVAAIPILMTLRKVDVFLHFMSRYFDGTDGPEVLRHQTQSLAADLTRLAAEITWIEEIFQDYLLYKLN
ncbi:homoserine kinase [compost metagenome]